MATQRPSMRDRIKEQAKTATTEGASYLILPPGKKVNFFNPKEGDFEIDMIPYEDSNGELQPYRRYKVHGGIGAEDNKYVCPTTIGKPCPICNARKEMAKSKSGDADLIKSLTPKERVLTQQIDLLDKKDDSVQLWDASYHAFVKDLLKAIDTAENSASTRKRSLPHAGFAELQGGQTLLVKMEESAKIKKFYQAVRIDAADRDDYGEEILDEVLNLDECLKILDYETLDAIFLELDPADQGSGRKREESTDEKTTGRTRGARGAAKEEEPPTRSRTRGVAKEEPQGEESEPAPAATSSRRRGATPPAEDPPPAATSSRRRGATAEPAQEEAPSGRRTRGAAAPEKDDRCWVEGGTFGKDCDTHLAEAPEPNCYDCPEETWTACKAAQDALNK